MYSEKGLDALVRNDVAELTCVFSMYFKWSSAKGYWENTLKNTLPNSLYCLEYSPGKPVESLLCWAPTGNLLLTQENQTKQNKAVSKNMIKDLENFPENTQPITNPSGVQ